jgi:hypothetical protein
LAIGRYPVHAEFFDRLLGGPSLPSVFDDRSTALPWRTIGPCGLQGWVDFPGSEALWHLGFVAFGTKKPSKPAYFLASRRIPAI